MSAPTACLLRTPPLIAWLAACLLVTTAAPAQGPTPVGVAPTTLEDLQAHRLVTGQLRAVARSKVATAEQGLVLERSADEGRPVRAGDLLAVLDSRRLEAQRVRLTAALAVAEAVEQARLAERDRAQHDLELLRDLSGRAAANMNELADAERDFAIAVARLEEAQRNKLVIAADQDLLALRLSDTRIVAPFDGVVVDVFADVGEWVSEGDAIAEVVATNRYEAWLDVPESLRTAVARSDVAATVEVRAVGLRAPGLPVQIVPVVDPVARTFRAIVAIDDAEGMLAAGMSASAWLPTGERDSHLTVPRDALLRNDAGFFVYVVREGERGTMALPVSLSVLFDHGDRVAVRGALEPGASVVVEGNEGLFPGSPVVVSRTRDAGGAD